MSSVSIPAAATQILRSSITFTSKLYQILAKKHGNVFFSPITLHAALAMLYLGAQEATATILEEVLQFPGKASTASGYRWILNHLRTTNETNLHIANKMYTRGKQIFLEEFSNSVQQYFNSEVENLGSRSNSEVMKQINEWDKVIDKEVLNEDTVLFLLSTFYFKAPWNHSFKEDETVLHPFYLDNDEVVEVQMMRGGKRGFYKDDVKLKCQILFIPYKERWIEMGIILPWEKNGIKDLEAKLATVNFADVIVKNLTEENLDISLPKFKFEYSSDLVDSFKEVS